MFSQNFVEKSKERAKRAKNRRPGVMNRMEGEYGHPNINMFVLSPKGRVLHRLGGYWPAADFHQELSDLVNAVGKIEDLDSDDEDTIAKSKELLDKFHNDHQLCSSLKLAKGKGDDYLKGIDSYHRRTHKWIMKYLLEDYNKVLEIRNKAEKKFCAPSHEKPKETYKDECDKEENDPDKK